MYSIILNLLIWNATFTRYSFELNPSAWVSLCTLWTCPNRIRCECENFLCLLHLLFWSESSYIREKFSTFKWTWILVFTSGYWLFYWTIQKDCSSGLYLSLLVILLVLWITLRASHSLPVRYILAPVYLLIFYSWNLFQVPFEPF